MRVSPLIAVVALLAVGSPAQAQVLVGADPSSPFLNGLSSSLPFGTTGVGDRYQQIYGASSFTGSFLITGINFIYTGPDRLGELNSGNYTFYLGTTSVAVGSLSQALSSNVGGHQSLFGSYVLTGGSVLASNTPVPGAPQLPTLGGQQMTLSFAGNGFLYDPTAGNLLLDIRMSNLSNIRNTCDPTQGPCPMDSGNYDVAMGGLTQARWSGFAGTNPGLVTYFTGQPVSVPEPTTWVLLLSSLVVLFGTRLGRTLDVDTA